MKHTRQHVFWMSVLLLGATALGACKRDMFDPDAYRELIEKTAPIGNIDKNHTWELVSTRTVQLQVSSSVEASTVRILSDNPNLSGHAEILAEQSVEAGEPLQVSFLAPTFQQQFVAAVITGSGACLLKPFTLDEPTVNLESGLVPLEPSAKEPDYQAFTYCFEEEYPKPSEDWDFNDLVLRLQQLPATRSDEVRLRITVAAVGAKKKLAAAVRLVGFSRSEVVGVTIEEEGRTFDNYSVPYSQERQFIEKSDLLLTARSGEAVLNLFEDAHWVMSPRLMSEGQDVVRMFYNTRRQPDGQTSAQLRAKSLTYVVKFSSADEASRFTLCQADPFVVEDFNSGKWEIHTARYKSAAVLRDYGSNETATSNKMTWALCIPSGSFRWPQEGIRLGYLKDGILTGAYMESNHSFGEWAQDRNASLDWFLHPTTGLVF